MRTNTDTDTTTTARVARHRGRRTLVALAAALACAIGTGDAGMAAVRQSIPDEQAGPPFYARIGTEAIHTDEWAAIPFYRDPSCVPSDFNLMTFFDAPRAFSCALTVEGHVVWKNGPPPQDFAPIQQNLRGAGPVPVWLVAWPELEAAMADGVLTIVELAALPSLQVGYADVFHETLHPAEAAKRGMIQLNARGTLDDGRAFSVQAVAGCGCEGDPNVRHVAITVG
jgi:hypothetical protein